MNDYDENKESTCFNYWHVNSLYGWAMMQKLPTSNFEWVENTSKFNEYFIKKYDEKSQRGYFPEVDVQYPKKIIWVPQRFAIFTRKKEDWKVTNLIDNLQDKNEYVVKV